MLWSYKTTPRSITGTSLFKLAFGIEVVSHVEISHSSSRIEFFNPKDSDLGQKFHNDLIEEVRDEAAKKMLLYQKKNAAYFNKKVKE